MIVFILLLIGIVEFKLLIALLNLIISSCNIHLEETLYLNLEFGIESRFFLFFGHGKVAHHRYHSCKLSLDVHCIELNAVVRERHLFPINLRPDCESCGTSKSELLVTHYHNTTLDVESKFLGAVAHLH